MYLDTEVTSALERWIATERTYPAIWIILGLGVFAGVPFCAGVDLLFRLPLVPIIEYQGAFLLAWEALALLLVVAKGGLTKGVSVSGAGVTLRRWIGAPVVIEAGKLVVKPVRWGFGRAERTGGNEGYWLSPNQFAAAKAAFPERVQVEG